jgi:hypothetical protein
MKSLIEAGRDGAAMYWDRHTTSHRFLPTATVALVGHIVTMLTLDVNGELLTTLVCQH